MQSLHSAITTTALESILKTIAALPSSEIERHSDIVIVHATKKSGGRVKVLSAATTNGKSWHVMAVPGLISIA